MLVYHKHQNKISINLWFYSPRLIRYQARIFHKCSRIYAISPVVNIMFNSKTREYLYSVYFKNSFEIFELTLYSTTDIMCWPTTLFNIRSLSTLCLLGVRVFCNILSINNVNQLLFVMEAKFKAKFMYLLGSN